VAWEVEMGGLILFARWGKKLVRPYFKEQARDEWHMFLIPAMWEG
jgi:hypothetical protein